MGPAIVAEILLQVACAYHCYRHGNTQPWLFVILLFPVVGSVIYLAAVVLPGLRTSRDARQLASGVRRLVDPDGELRDRLNEAEFVGSLAAKRSLADELMHRGDYPKAAKLLESITTGAYKDDAGLLFLLARARFGACDYVGTIKALDDLRAANPEWQSGDAHLLYARALEGEGRDQEALSEYQAVVRYFTGEEARCRLALFLRKLGRSAEARDIWQAIVKSSERANKLQWHMQGEWYALAKRNLAG
ncbi:MAG: hypothetical protein GC190_03325 [Alphaproteobacteria bacterium]|nr:hypothetical protein [Alphaproteobacteria bacterium]